MQYLYYHHTTTITTVDNINIGLPYPWRECWKPITGRLFADSRLFAVTMFIVAKCFHSFINWWRFGNFKIAGILQVCKINEVSTTSYTIEKSTFYSCVFDANLDLSTLLSTDMNGTDHIRQSACEDASWRDERVGTIQTRWWSCIDGQLVPSCQLWWHRSTNIILGISAWVQGCQGCWTGEWK